MEINRIYLGDCMNLLGGVPDNFCDVAFTSPPYNIRHGGDVNDPDKRDPWGKSKYGGNEYRKDWYEWQVGVIDELLRVSKKLVVYNVQANKDNKQNVYGLIGHYKDIIHDIVIWYKPNGQPTSTPHKVSNTYEFILIMKPEGVSDVKSTQRFSRNVIVEPVNQNPFSKVHGAVMNMNVAKTIISRYSAKGDIVIDPFMGLGTTALVCEELGRKYIGFEKEKQFVDIANERLEEQKSQIRWEF